MLSYVESGIIKHLLTKDLPEAVICPLNLGSKDRQLRSSDLFTTYAIIITGFFLASIVFCVEISRKCGRINESKMAAKNKRQKRIDFMKKTMVNSINLHQGTIAFANASDWANKKNSDAKDDFIHDQGLSAILFNRY